MKWWILGLAVLLAACSTGGTPEEDLVQEDAVVDIAQDAGFSTFTQELNDTFGNDEFRGGGPYTFFAPTDAAFAAADLGEVELDDLLEYHIVQGEYALSDLQDGTLETLGGTVDVSVREGDVTLNGGEATVTTPNDLMAANGVVHAIDGVLIPGGFDGDPEPVEGEMRFVADLVTLPDVVGDAAGGASAALDGATLTVSGSVQDLSGPVTKAGLYEGGGDDAGRLLYDLEVDDASLSGSVTLDEQQLRILQDGDLYVTVSTAAYPEGEVSGPLQLEED